MVIAIHFDLKQRQDTSGCKLARFLLLIREFILTENLRKYYSQYSCFTTASLFPVCVDGQTRHSHEKLHLQIFTDKFLCKLKLTILKKLNYLLLLIKFHVIKKAG